MRKLFFTVLIVFSTHLANAQIKAVTESGDEVILYKDGTWKYLNDSIVEKSEIAVNDKKITKATQSTFLVKSNRLNIGIWINPKSWSFTKGKDSDEYEFEFQKKGDDLYAMLITEKVQVPIETLKGFAIENARDASPDIKVIKEEYRTVNGVQVFMMQMSGTVEGIRITYYGYYYSNSNGTIQLLTYTGENLFTGYLSEIESFLNGFVAL